MIRSTIGAFRRSPLAVTASMVNRQRESDRKAPPMTIGVLSSAFVSLQRIPRLVVDAFLLSRAACRQRGSMTEIGFGNGRIGGAGEDLDTALSLRRRPLSSASWRHRYRRCDFRCRPVGYRKTVDERLHDTHERLDRETSGDVPMISRMIQQIENDGGPGLRSRSSEMLDLHKAVTDPPSRWHRKCHPKGWRIV